MFPGRQLATESLTKYPAITNHDRTNLWRNVTRLALALSRKVDRPEHEISVAGMREAFLRGHSRNVTNTNLHSNVSVVGSVAAEREALSSRRAAVRLCAFRNHTT
jgi:hypothetical protein